MNDILAFPRSVAPAGPGPARPVSSQVLRFAPRMRAGRSRLVAAWRVSEVDGRLECCWLPEGGGEGARRSRASRRCRVFLPHAGLLARGGTALSIGHAGRYSAEVP